VMKIGPVSTTDLREKLVISRGPRSSDFTEKSVRKIGPVFHYRFTWKIGGFDPLQNL
jgi:hypothetical protein